jgi:hypothetical protein
VQNRRNVLEQLDATVECAAADHVESKIGMRRLAALRERHVDKARAQGAVEILEGTRVDLVEAGDGGLANVSYSGGPRVDHVTRDETSQDVPVDAAKLAA